ncbi:uncharacterized protein EAF01_005528 [Botrytis porri]|uniref:Uncharacterized protein n=1 Tax=Botrytis porri TaxID=87229 RepID=A0A4Z1KNI2_9HELO|nr:uncharacterized protein EAF01_005528 [Botrytis porri]KAF7905006.1 hypothetical protein EAF01_005528 [Botrytis porri]TGO87018.1 hypothetical protein BPOR_0258g00070 [Botrytis porri]
MKPEHEKEILKSFHHQLKNLNIYAKRYCDSISEYIKTRQDFHVQYIDRARDQVISGLHELKLKQGRHPEVLTDLVTQAVVLFEELIGVNLGLEERVDKYKRENNTLKARITGIFRRRRSDAPKESDYTTEEIAEYARLGLHLGQHRIGRD